MLIDGVDIKKYDEDTLRKTVAVVQQRAALFLGYNRGQSSYGKGRRNVGRNASCG